ncbi:MAG: hypothetical protein RIM72_02920 [Alphaproteobacteria bacterium]
MSDDIRTLIREVLAEELRAFKADNNRGDRVSVKPDVKVEAVSIESDKDLNTFAAHILDVAKNPDRRAAVENGTLVFRLTNSRPSNGPGHQAGSVTVSYEKGLISERQISELPDGAHIKAGKKTCFTPLARDEIRRKRIRLERTKS